MFLEEEVVYCVNHRNRYAESTKLQKPQKSRTKAEQILAFQRHDRKDQKRLNNRYSQLNHLIVGGGLFNPHP